MLLHLLSLNSDNWSKSAKQLSICSIQSLFMEKRYLYAVLHWVTFFLIFRLPQETSICCKNMTEKNKRAKHVMSYIPYSFNILFVTRSGGVEIWTMVLLLRRANNTIELRLNNALSISTLLRTSFCFWSQIRTYKFPTLWRLLSCNGSLSTNVWRIGFAQEKWVCNNYW